jgi:hypothetical protein
VVKRSPKAVPLLPVTRSRSASNNDE